jgi:cellulose synthase (UDP-forming)
LALINPKLGDFNATSKGGIVEKEYVDWNLSKPYIVLLILNVIGFFVGVLKLVFVDVTVSTLLINLAWVSFNIIIISASSNVAREIKQLRVSPRVNTKLPATILLSNGKTIVCEISDFSRNGVDITTAIPISLPVGDHILVSIFRGSKEVALPGTIARCGKSIGVYFENLTVAQQKDFTQITFSRADNWVNVWAKESTDAPLNSLKEVLTYGVLNLGPLLRDAGNDLYTAVRAKAKRMRAKA